MAMKVSREEFLGIDEPLKPSFENVAAKMALDFEAEVFMRLKKLGLKRKDLAELLGVSPAAISKLLVENSNMTLKTMSKVAVALGCDISPIHLNEIGAVSYVDLDNENESETTTVIVPKEMLSVDSTGEVFSIDAPVSRSASASFSAKASSMPFFRRVAA